MCAEMSWYRTTSNNFLRVDNDVDINVLQEIIMKRIILCFAFVFVAITLANAQQSSGIEISVNSGFVIPSSPMTFANFWQMQYGGGFGMGITLSESITLLGSAEYYRFTLNEDGISKNFNTRYMKEIWIFNDVSLHPSAGTSSVMTGSANLRISPTGLTGFVSPYLVAGAGVMIFSISEISLPTTSVLSLDSASVSMTAQRRIIGGKETAAFLQCGIGMDVHVTSVLVMFAEARFVGGLTRELGASYVPLTAGVRMKL